MFKWKTCLVKSLWICFKFFQRPLHLLSNYSHMSSKCFCRRLRLFLDAVKGLCKGGIVFGIIFLVRFSHTNFYLFKYTWSFAWKCLATASGAHSTPSCLPTSSSSVRRAPTRELWRTSSEWCARSWGQTRQVTLLYRGQKRFLEFGRETILLSPSSSVLCFLLENSPQFAQILGLENRFVLLLASNVHIIPSRTVWEV